MKRQVLDPPQIHPTAMIDPTARIDPGVVIEPYAAVGRSVSIGERTRIGAFTIVGDHTHIGPRNRIYHHASVGTDSQDMKFKGEESYLKIGEANIIREYTALNRATGAGESTVIGNHNILMAFCHVAHNATIGDHCVIANAAQIAGHVVVGDYAIVGGLVAVHQYCRIGAHVLIGAGSKTTQDVPPFILADGHPAWPRGLNRIGLKRRGFSAKEIETIEEAYSIIYRKSLRVEEAVEQLEQKYSDAPHIAKIIDFLASASRGIIRPGEKKAPCFRKVKRSA